MIANHKSRRSVEPVQGDHGHVVGLGGGELAGVVAEVLEARASDDGALPAAVRALGDTARVCAVDVRRTCGACMRQGPELCNSHAYVQRHCTVLML